jgi:hypothetical protein
MSQWINTYYEEIIAAWLDWWGPGKETAYAHYWRERREREK